MIAAGNATGSHATAPPLAAAALPAATEEAAQDQIQEQLSAEREALFEEHRREMAALKEQFAKELDEAIAASKAEVQRVPRADMEAARAAMIADANQELQVLDAEILNMADFQAVFGRKDTARLQGAVVKNSLHRSWLRLVGRRHGFVLVRGDGTVQGSLQGAIASTATAVSRLGAKGAVKCGAQCRHGVDAELAFALVSQRRLARLHARLARCKRALALIKK